TRGPPGGTHRRAGGASGPPGEPDAPAPVPPHGDRAARRPAGRTGRVVLGIAMEGGRMDEAVVRRDARVDWQLSSVTARWIFIIAAGAVSFWDPLGRELVRTEIVVITLL